MSTLKSIVIMTALTASTTAFALETSYPRAGSGGGPGRSGFFAAGSATTGTVIAPATIQRPAQASMVRGGNGGGNSLGGRASSQPFTPTPQQALSTAD